MSRRRTAGAPRLDGLSLLFGVLGGLVLLFIIAPLAGLVLQCSPGELVRTARDPEVARSMGLTLWTSMAATCVLALAAVPAAYLLARRAVPLKGLILGIINVPVVIPHSAAGIALLAILSRSSVAGGVAERLGLSFVGTPAGIMVAMAFVSLPFLMNAAYDGFLAVPERLEKAARTLGAGPFRVFFTIALPLAWRPILSGLVLMWARGLSEFGAVIILAYHPMVTPVQIFQRFNDFGLSWARPVAAVFILVCLLVFVGLRLLSRRASHAEA
jgi:molybdate/tungstate transport system permease protein